MERPARETMANLIFSERAIVLVVDDHDAVRRAAENAVQSLGFDALGAENGERAVDLFAARHHEIAAVLLDLSMPGLSGRELLQRLKQIDPTVRVVLSSGYAEADAVSALAGEHPGCFLQKPYTVQQLAEQIGKALR